MKEVNKFIRISPEKNNFFEGYAWLRLNNLGLALGRHREKALSNETPALTKSRNVDISVVITS